MRQALLFCMDHVASNVFWIFYHFPENVFYKVKNWSNPCIKLKKYFPRNFTALMKNIKRINGLAFSLVLHQFQQVMENPGKAWIKAFTLKKTYVIKERDYNCVFPSTGCEKASSLDYPSNSKNWCCKPNVVNFHQQLLTRLTQWRRNWFISSWYVRPKLLYFGKPFLINGSYTRNKVLGLIWFLLKLNILQ